MKIDKASNFIGGLIALLAMLSLICLFLGAPVMLLWNWTLPHIFNNIPPISFWQAVGLNLLCSILFKSTTNIKTNKN